MVNLDGSFFIQVINFIFLVFVLNAVLYKPIRSILIQRKEKITGLEQGIETLSGDAKEKDDAFVVGIKDARGKGLKEKERLLQEAGDEEKRIIGKITTKAQADLAEIREKVAQDTEDVRQTLLGQVDEYANSIGQKILGRAV